MEQYLYPFFILVARWGKNFNATLLPLYPQERPGTHYVGAGLGSCDGLYLFLNVSTRSRSPNRVSRL